MRILFNIIIALCLSACGSGESKNSGNSENSASPQQSTQMSDGKSGMPMVNVDEQGVIKGSPIHQSNSSAYYPCEGVISPEFKQVVYALTANLSKGMKVPLPQDSLCAVSQGKPGSIGGMMITAQMYIDSSSMRSCIFDNFCNDTRAVMIFPPKDGKLLFNTMVINAESKQTMQVCMDIDGKILSNQGCASVGKNDQSSNINKIHGGVGEDANITDGYETFMHNGSVMALYRHDTTISIFYLEPRNTLFENGVKRGSLLFSGAYVGDTVEGTAYSFKKGCEPAPYDVNGADGGSVIRLFGAAPVRPNRSCAVNGYNSSTQNAMLIFTLK